MFSYAPYLILESTVTILTALAYIFCLFAASSRHCRPNAGLDVDKSGDSSETAPTTIPRHCKSI